MKTILLIFLFLSGILSGACSKNDVTPSAPEQTATGAVTISTDKAAYSPGSTVVFTIDKAIPSDVKIRYRHFSDVVSEQSLTGTTWQWTAPSADFTGYLIDIYGKNSDGSEKIYGTVGVDVSSDWSRFPRYGFLSSYSQMSVAAVGYVLDNLTRYHINGLQFYDWQYKHHCPLAGTVASPTAVWKDIANRDTYFATVKAYIDGAHARNMKAMFYNLAYGALSDAAADGVAEQWYVYADNSHATKKCFNLPSPMFKSNIWLLDPSNSGWQQYIASRNRDVYSALGFDGYHIDQLGDQGTVYNYNGVSVDLPSAFQSFINAMKTDKQDKHLVMNAVNQFGQQNMAAAPVDFLYTEVWSPNDGYKDLASVITANDTYSGNTKNSVLAAYMDYDLANSTGFFNTAGVLLTDAVIFAFGGAHIELGEHMLGKEYFPNSNLQMPGTLRDALICYYDFSVAYQNLLRDGGTLNTPAVTCTNGQMSINQWPPQSNKVAVCGRDFGMRQTINFLNFNGINNLNWRDNNGTQPIPVSVSNAAVNFSTAKTVKKIWMASPDINNCVPYNLPFTQSGSIVSFTLPSLQYWDMVVVEY
jgi:dextranase